MPVPTPTTPPPTSTRPPPKPAPTSTAPPPTPTARWSPPTARSTRPAPPSATPPATPATPSTPAPTPSATRRPTPRVKPFRLAETKRVACSGTRPFLFAARYGKLGPPGRQRRGVADEEVDGGGGNGFTSRA